ncbi:MAG: acyl-CoA dehydrogenase family protein [Candidatus Marinimicrobia bacterium]|jgi:alkylation response protein AidB-like acyl-CoA dehydrogenase|nr:acyl-CoA dehydrogenase family protein [Candidatus Neomarinimicrobiota bacterium]|tara:strand:- start:971 stop:2758 length:1788 start_codon:yes stop_codon:yes gene_type:complete
MSDVIADIRTGGTFLLNPVGTFPIFTREQFTEEQREIENLAREFCINEIFPRVSDIEKYDQELSHNLIKQMGELGLLSIDIPEKYDGLELDKITAIIVAESMRYGGSSSFTTTYSVQSGIGMLPIVWFGTDKQKQKYLPKLSSGEWIGAYALTEPEAGSDAMSGRMTACLSEDGKHYILNGEKQFISNGGWAQVFTVFAQVDGTKFTAFIVEPGTPGFEIGAEEHKLGVKGSSTVAFKFTDVKVPVDNLLGKIGGGAAIAFNALNVGRLKLGASVLGGNKEIIEYAAEYALQRRQFGQPIAHFDIIRKYIADMTVRTYALDSIVYRTVGDIDRAIADLDQSADDFYIKMGEEMERFAIESSMVKVYGSDTAGFCADMGIQILGGYGYIEEYPMARIYRDSRIQPIWEGSNEINRQIITGYFMKKALLEEIPMREKIKCVGEFLATDPVTTGESPLWHQMAIIEAGKYLTLYVFDEALKEFGQDLKHEQQLGELLANAFMDLYLADSTVARISQLDEGNGHEHILEAIAKTFTAEMALRLLNSALTGLNDIYHGHLPEAVMETLRKFQIRLLPITDVAAMKRQIADYIYQRKTYPF